MIITIITIIIVDHTSSRGTLDITYGALFVPFDDLLPPVKLVPRLLPLVPLALTKEAMGYSIATVSDACSSGIPFFPPLPPRFRVVMYPRSVSMAAPFVAVTDKDAAVVVVVVVVSAAAAEGSAPRTDMPPPFGTAMTTA
jgi:hypothetical protein